MGQMVLPVLGSEVVELGATGDIFVRSVGLVRSPCIRESFSRDIIARDAPIAEPG